MQDNILSVFACTVSAMFVQGSDVVRSVQIEWDQMTQQRSYQSPGDMRENQCFWQIGHFATSRVLIRN